MPQNGSVTPMTDAQKIDALRDALTVARRKLSTLPDREQVNRVLAATDR